MDSFQEFVDVGRADEALRTRRRTQWLRQQAEEDATFLGTLTDLAERGGVVTLRTASGRAHQGVMIAVGHDYCAVRTVRGQMVYLALDAVDLVRPEPGIRHDAATGDRDALHDRTLLEVLARVVGDRPRVALVTRRGEQAVAGQLRAVGQDVVTVRLDGDERGVAYVRVGALTELTLLDQ